MIPQKASKLPQYIAGIVVAIYTVNNPAKAAGLVNKAFEAINTFAGALG